MSIKKQVFYIHGGEAFSQYQAFLDDLRTRPVRNLPGQERSLIWVDTLREDLGDDFDVFMPTMPNKQNAKYLEWKIWFERHFEYLRDGVQLVGWSQGGYFLAKYLSEETLPFVPARLVLVAAPVWPDDFDGEDGGDFAFDVAHLPQIAKKVSKVNVFHSTDDLVVPFNHAEAYLRALPQAELVSFADKGHFVVPELPELIERLRG
jgi:uncharacterized protein